MSSWIKLSDVGAWLDRRYKPYCRVGNGWGPSNLYDALAEALRGGSIRARGTSLRSRGRQRLIFMPDQSVDILPHHDGWDVSVSGQKWWGVEIEAAGLEIYCDYVLGPQADNYTPVFEMSHPLIRPNARRPRNSARQIAEQLWPDGNMPASNKAAIQAVRVEMERQNLPTPSDSTISRALGFRD